MTDYAPIADLVDAGSGFIPGGSGRIEQQKCAREACKVVLDDGHDFCPECLAWLRGDEDEDPLTTPAPPAPKVSSLTPAPPPVTDDDEDWWYGAFGVAGYV